MAIYVFSNQPVPSPPLLTFTRLQCSLSSKVLRWLLWLSPSLCPQYVASHLAFGPWETEWEKGFWIYWPLPTYWNSSCLDFIGTWVPCFSWLILLMSLLAALILFPQLCVLQDLVTITISLTISKGCFWMVRPYTSLPAPYFRLPSLASLIV